jgi:aminoglycoside phosphotransferase (APT) family kinase protein
MSVEDRAGPVRAGEAFDVALLHDYLRARLDGLEGLPEVTQYSGGASNWTYRLRYPGQDLVLRRAPAGTKARGAHDMGREYRLQAALRPVYPYVPEVLLHCDDPAVLGAEFYVMRRCPGLILRKELPAGLSLDAAAARALCERFVEALVELHRIDPEPAGLLQLGKGAGYAARQVEGWTERYRRARTWNVPSGEYVADWLRANVPSTERIRLVHNDFRFDNLVLDPADTTRIVGVLDWELATVGDPWMDLGSSLAYWVEAGDDPIGRSFRRQPTHLPGMMTRRELVEAYEARSGSRPESWAFYEVFGLFRLSVIAQQIYYRYHRKETRNPAFSRFWLAVGYLHLRCRLAIRAAQRVRGRRSRS